MNILSLFDGISCGMVALKRVGISVDKYYASEIDKYAIEISRKNHPEIVQLGDIKDWKKWKKLNIDLSKIDLVLAGFPCQSWSIAGKQKGNTDPRGALVHDLIAIWNEIKKNNPKVKFIFENVKMKKEFLEYMNSLFGVEPIMINSALVSAQNRKRYYWTNIKVEKQPVDRKIFLNDIIEKGWCDREKSYCIDANYSKGGNLKEYFEKRRRQLVFNMPVVAQMSERGRRIKSLNVQNRFENLIIRKLTPAECECLQTLPKNYTEGVSNAQRYKMIGNGWTVDVISYILSCLHT